MTIRTRLPLGHVGPVHFSALAGYSTFLYRRTADRRHAVLGVDNLNFVEVAEPGNGFSRWTEFLAGNSDHSMGHLSYELGLEVEPSVGRYSADPTGFPLIFWFIPKFLFEWVGDEVFLNVHAADEPAGLELAKDLFNTDAHASSKHRTLAWECTSRDRYLRDVEKALQHTQRGDIYEMNYCIERRAHAEGWDPYSAFHELLHRTDAPFAAFYRSNEHFALCASPERFLQFEGRSVLSEPMKGTRPRANDPILDAKAILELQQDPKERAENIMATDVVRNDLSRIAAPGSVHVPELCAVRSFPAVHQLISRVRATIADGHSHADVVRACFPMASMTGAPKVRAMQLIHELERRPRGVFSGSIGHFAPDGTGDLNVVIRTLTHNARSGHISLMTGSAITAACDPAQEWEECTWKAASVLDMLAHGASA